ncbi:MAG TPA: hypothetical protein H9881_16585 [Candidatus Stackebrandtia excrementipullorum]|nr:hypothetical protein [Candidatus Stackebrandtia excrementipullorum]
MRSPTKVAAIVVIGALTVTACSSSGDSGEPPDSITIVQGSGPANLNPLQDETRAVQSVFSTMFETLTVIDSDRELQPLLATDWEQTDDTTWRFNLRDDVEFHNGEPFNAEAVTFTIERMQDPAQKSTKLARLGGIDTAEVVDEYTVDITTTSPMPLLPNEMSQLYIVPPQYTTENPETSSTEAVGTGPYELSSYEPGQKVVVTVFDGYWGAQPEVKTINWEVIADESARIASLQSGTSDLINGFSPDQVPTLEAGGLNVKAGKSGLGMVLTMNTLSGPFEDVRVRQAAALAVDIPAIVQELLGGYAEPLDNQLQGPETFGYNEALAPVQRDVEAAADLLADAGHANGVDITFEAPSGRYTNDRQVAEAIAAQLEEAGFNVSTTVQEYQPFLESVKTKETDMYFIGWYSTPLFDASNSLTWFTSDNVFSYWQDSAYDDALATAASSSDPAVRQAAFDEATSIMAEESPAVFLYDSQTLFAAGDKLADWEPRGDDLIWYRDLTTGSASL